MWHEAFLIKEAGRWDRRMMEIFKRKPGEMKKFFQDELGNQFSRRDVRKVVRGQTEGPVASHQMDLFPMPGGYSMPPVVPKHMGGTGVQNPHILRREVLRSKIMQDPRLLQKATQYQDRAHKAFSNQAPRMQGQGIGEGPGKGEQYVMNRLKKMPTIKDHKLVDPLTAALPDPRNPLLLQPKRYPGYVPGSEHLYRGVSSPDIMRELTNPKLPFYTPHPKIAAGYGFGGISGTNASGIMYRIKDPMSAVTNQSAIARRSLRTPHLSEQSIPGRHRAAVNQFGPGDLHQGSKTEGWERLRDYETVLPAMNPKLVDRIYLPTAQGKYQNQVTHARELGKRVGGTLQPIDWSDMQRLGTDHQKALRSFEQFNAPQLNVNRVPTATPTLSGAA